jgi:hypothetical protein
VPRPRLRDREAVLLSGLCALQLRQLRAIAPRIAFCICAARLCFEALCLAPSVAAGWGPRFKSLSLLVMITASSASRITSPIEAELKLGASHFCDGLMDHLAVGSLWVARMMIIVIAKCTRLANRCARSGPPAMAKGASFHASTTRTEHTTAASLAAVTHPSPKTRLD